jgi:patatin-like phospholipase/acyl hydrolase
MSVNDCRKILSIDGGGIKGVFPAAFLADIETTLPLALYSYFDLIVGTSTGGIIALGLGLGLTASQILDFYRQHGPKIFKGNRFVLTVKQALWRKYSNEQLRRALEQTFGNRKLSESKTRLVIPSFNIDTGEVYIYKTRHHERFERDHEKTAVEAALATASAPTFFPLFKNSSEAPLVDGGVWANNPTSVAVAEAIGILGWTKDQLRVLSVGCTEEPFDVGLRRRKNIGALWAFAPQTANVLMQGQSSGSLGIAYTLLGHENVIRINETVRSGRFGMDEAKTRLIAELAGLGRNRARNESGRIKPIFFDRPAEPFCPTAFEQADAMKAGRHQD